MIVSDLFEDIPIASGEINPNTGRVWLPSELRAEYEAEQKIKQAEAERRAEAEREAAAAEVAKYPTSSTAPAPSSVTYKNLTPPKKAKPDFTQRTGVGYKLPGTPTVPTVPNMTQAPAKPSAPVQPEPITIGGQKISPSDPAYAKIMKNAPVGAAISGPPAAEKIAVDDITKQLNRQLKLVKTKDDLKNIKQLIDRQFAKHGLVSESAFVKRDQLIKRATKILENRSN